MASTAMTANKNARIVAVFNSLSNKLQDTVQKLRGQDKITEANIDAAIAEIRKQLLESDVSLKAVKLFTNRVREEALGEKVLRGVKPGEQLVKIIHNALIERLGGDNQGKGEAGSGSADKLPRVPLSESLSISTDPTSPLPAPTSLILLGLQGSGKTTAAAKLAYKLKQEGQNPLLIPCDLQRPAAVKQLKILAEQAGVDFVNIVGSGKREVGEGEYLLKSPLELSKLAEEQAKANNNNVLIFDTAGRLQIDTDLMAELLVLEKQTKASHKLLVIDSLIGQEAANVAETFNTQIGITGTILSKLDSDTKGGAALSVVEATGKAIQFASVGEKLEDLEAFYPERMASRILGMGDVLSLVEKAEEKIAEEESKRLEAELLKGNFNYETFVSAQNMLSKLGDFGQVFKMMGMGSMLSQMGLGSADQDSMLEQGQSKIERFKIAISSMTIKERKQPDLLSSHPTASSRKARIAKGCGQEISDIEKLTSEFTKMAKTFKQLGPMLGMLQSGDAEMPSNPQDLMGQMMGASMSKKQQKALKQSGAMPALPKPKATKKAKKGEKPKIKGFRD